MAATPAVAMVTPGAMAAAVVAVVATAPSAAAAVATEAPHALDPTSAAKCAARGTDPRSAGGGDVLCRDGSTPLWQQQLLVCCCGAVWLVPMFAACKAAGGACGRWATYQVLCYCTSAHTLAATVGAGLFDC